MGHLRSVAFLNVKLMRKEIIKARTGRVASRTEDNLLGRAASIVGGGGGIIIVEGEKTFMRVQIRFDIITLQIIIKLRLSL